VRGTNVVSRGKRAPHWKLIDDADVQNVVQKVAKSIAGMNQGILEEDDLYQEGLMLVATVPHIGEQAIIGEYGLLYTRVRTELMQRFVEKMDRSGELNARKYRNIPVEDADNEPIPSLAFDDGTGDYTEEAIKVLLPAVWDESYAYGLPDRDDAPDRDMPKSASNKARANNHWAYIADVKTGWEKTPLTRLERRALLMAYGLGYTHADIARVEGIDRSAISRRIDNAIRKIVARLNGARIEEEN
jgi:hypothetical protein